LDIKKNSFVHHRKYYISVTAPSRWMLCKFWDIHGFDYEEFCLLECYSLWLLWKPTFRKNVSSPPSQWHDSISLQRVSVARNC
jgi:hypothetical protein